MKNKGKLLLTLFLITWILFALTLFINFGNQFIGKSYFKSDEFQAVVESYKEQLGRYVLSTFDAEKAKEQISVTDIEIEYYRTFYGSLPEQIESIQVQYSDRINQAEIEGNVLLKEQLIIERDTKIADIEKNFSNDDYVEEKIRKEKERLIDQYAQDHQNERKQFINEFNYLTYHFTNIETGETIASKNYQTDSYNIFTQSFGKQNPNFIVDNTVDISTYDGYYAVQGDAVQEEFLSFNVNGEVAQFEGTLSIPRDLFATSDLYENYTSFHVAQIVFYLIWATGIIAFIGLVTFMKPAMKDFALSEKAEKIVLKWPIDIRVVIVLMIAFITFNLMENVGYKIQYNLVPYAFEIMIYFIVIFILSSATILCVIWLWNLAKNVERLKEEWKFAFIYRLGDGIRDLFLNTSIAFQSIVILAIAFFAGIGFAGVMIQPVLAVIYLVLFFFIALPAAIIFLRRMGYLNRIMKQTEEMAEGRLTAEIKVKGKSPFAQHASNLNRIREGVKTSMTEQAKSERLKTELITNVSHDLRTPLTSIITYTDLLKNPTLTEEERKQYIDILDKKSARLKTLIEDLFEVSKMASGNIEMAKQRIDLTQLFQQAIGEHEEAFEQANLELRITKPNGPLYAYVDGQKIWRVIDNLVGNALKYSLKGSRIYITLKQIGHEAEFTVKNISNYELGDNVDELTERFKRADASRHTDGSGLGLAIAQSIVNLHNGRLKVEVDGDLFKVIVTIPADY